MSELPRVSAIIPARNEEANIAPAVRSLAAQAGLREIIVVNDQSEDRTGEVLEGLRSEIPELRCLRIDALPPGWVGKTFAAATGARAAAGEWLLFTDADVEHLPGSLEALLARAIEESADLLSVSPGQVTVRWWEKAVIPFVFVRLAKVYRFEEVSDPAAAANGQYLLIRRAAYERAGGHEAVQAEILEDVALARRVKGAGGRLVFLPGPEWVRTRMYRSFGPMWHGWTKNLYPLYGREAARVARTLAEVWLLDVVSFLGFVLASILFFAGRGGGAAAVGAVGCFTLALVRQWDYGAALARLGFEVGLANFHPLSAALFGLLLLNSTRCYAFGRDVRWQGRRYSTRRAE